MIKAKGRYDGKINLLNYIALTESFRNPLLLMNFYFFSAPQKGQLQLPIDSGLFCVFTALLCDKCLHKKDTADGPVTFQSFMESYLPT